MWVFLPVSVYYVVRRGNSKFVGFVLPVSVCFVVRRGNS